MGSIIMTWSSLLRSERHSSSACLSREALEKVELFGEEAQLLVEPCLPPHVYCEIKQIVPNRRTLNACKDAVQLALAQSTLVISTFDLVSFHAAHSRVRGAARPRLAPGACTRSIRAACAHARRGTAAGAAGAAERGLIKCNLLRARTSAWRPAPTPPFRAAGGAHAVHLALLRGRRQQQLGRQGRAAGGGRVAQRGGDGGAVAAAGPVLRAQGRPQAGAARLPKRHHARHPCETPAGCCHSARRCGILGKRAPATPAPRPRPRPRGPRPTRRLLLRAACRCSQDLILQYITHLYVASLALAQQHFGLGRIATDNPMGHPTASQPATPQASPLMHPPGPSPSPRLRSRPARPAQPMPAQLGLGQMGFHPGNDALAIA
jgi:hypothetical protein